MRSPVKLRNIIRYIHPGEQGVTAYLNRETGEILTVPDEVFARAEGGDSSGPSEDLSAYRRAREILDAGDAVYLEIPSRYALHEERLMADFCETVSDPKICAILHEALDAPDAIKGFKEKVREHVVEEKWERFRDDALKRFAVDWCLANGVPFTEV